MVVLYTKFFKIRCELALLLCSTYNGKLRDKLYYFVLIKITKMVYVSY